MTDYVLRPDDFNSIGKTKLAEHNIDANKDGKIDGDELGNLFELEGGNNKDNISHLLVNESDGTTTSRVKEPEVQDAIENFDKLPADQKAEVMKKYADKLSERNRALSYTALPAVDDYAKIDYLEDRMATAASDILSIYESGLPDFIEMINNDLDKYTQMKTEDLYKELNKPADLVDGQIHKYIITIILDMRTLKDATQSLRADVNNALITFGDKDLFGNDGTQATTLGNKVVSDMNNIKRDIDSSEAKINSALKTGNRQVLTTEFANLFSRIKKNRKSVHDSIAHLAMQTDNERNIAYARIQSGNYSDINKDLNMDNKVAENVLVDVLLEAPKADPTGISDTTADNSRKNGKYIENGRIKIINNGNAYNTNGTKW